MSYSKKDLEWFEEIDNQFSDEDRKKEIEEESNAVLNDLELECNNEGDFIFNFQTKTETGEHVEFDVYECCGKCGE